MGRGSRTLIGLLIMGGALTATTTAEAKSVSARFNMPSDHGYRIIFDGGDYGGQADASLTASDDSRTGSSGTSYFLSQGVSISETHIEASLGARGAVSVDFHEQSERKVDSQFCEGYQVIKRGTFNGKFSFTGEHGFAESSGTRAKGTITISRIRHCGGGDHGGHGGHGGSVADFFGLASCSPDSNLSYLGFGSGSGNRPAFHFASEFETGRRLSIFRNAITSGDASTFKVTPGGESAVVAPATPFAGRGTYSAHKLTGDLSVTFPGVEEPVALTPAKATLKRSKGGSFSSRCGGAVAVGNGRRAGGAPFPDYEREMRATVRRLRP